jgi:hypothetical protein
MRGFHSCCSHLVAIFFDATVSSGSLFFLVGLIRKLKFVQSAGVAPMFKVTQARAHSLKKQQEQQTASKPSI